MHFRLMCRNHLIIHILHRMMVNFKVCMTSLLSESILCSPLHPHLSVFETSTVYRYPYSRWSSKCLLIFQETCHSDYAGMSILPYCKWQVLVSVALSANDLIFHTQ